jgi:hypothetical protein
MQRQQHATQPELSEQHQGVSPLITIHEPVSPGGTSDLCGVLARILARVCAEPDPVNKRRRPRP